MGPIKVWASIVPQKTYVLKVYFTVGGNVEK
jgi:hypothetical protein